MSEKLNSFLSSYTRESREIALSLRSLILNVFSDAIEQIDQKSGMFVYSCERTFTDIVCTVAPHSKHVTLMFTQGSQIPDPSKLFCGTGRYARHIKIGSEAEIANPALQDLLIQAVKLACQH